MRVSSEGGWMVRSRGFAVLLAVTAAVLLLAAVGGLGRTTAAATTGHVLPGAVEAPMDPPTPTPVP